MKSDDFLNLFLPVFIGAAVRSSVLLHPYSGQGKPPLYGDYEAQRHWMEITTSLAPLQWYTNSTDNDLNYWGLDYPPLTAYHSWILGKISERIDPRWTALLVSRGFETYEHKVFMRYTVLFSDLLFFVPAVSFFFHRAIPCVPTKPCLSPFYGCLLTLVYPGLILIDHGHFQYNCVSLGLFVAAVGLLLTNCDILGSVCFCLALGYKQMELYHSLPIFFYLLGRCLRLSIKPALLKLCYLAVTVIITFSLIFSPFLSNIDALSRVLHRLFPLTRGLFEDKVSNFWCASSPFVKWRSLFSQHTLVCLCSIFVLLSNIPCCISLLLSPCKRKLLLSLAISSMGFFLFSYQVHEKSVLLVAVPALLLLPLNTKSSFLFSIVSTLSMWPLLHRDNLCLASFCTVILYVTLGSMIIFRGPRSSSSNMLNAETLLSFILLGFAFLITAQLCLSPPLSYPDLFPLLFSAFSFVQFLIFFFYWNWLLFYK